MIKRAFGKTDLQLSVIGFGGIPIQRLSAQEAQQVLHQALDKGINFFDTARGYTDSEEKIGRALFGRLEGAVLATKAMARDDTGMTKDIETSLRNLQTDTIDLYQIHGLGSEQQLEQVLGPGGAYQALERAREQGKVRYIGVTGHVQDVLWKAIRTELFDAVQFPYNPIETDWDEKVLPEAKRMRLGVIGMKPLAGGALQNVAAALRFSLHRGIHVVIPGMDSLSQVSSNAEVGKRLLPLDQSELLALKKEKQTWNGRFCRRCGYCMPCQNGLDIPVLLLLQAYHERYGLHEWAKARLSVLSKTYRDCESCGDCLPRCPYQLSIPELMNQAARQMAN